MDTPDPRDGAAFKRYWCHGAGLARWSTSPHPWTTLVRLLTKHMAVTHARGLASNYFKEVFGIWPGHRAGKNKTGPG